jgi:SAM-dependent methyltransferase
MFKKYNIPFDLDDPRTTLAHREIILNKPFLKKLYEEYYTIFLNETETVPPGRKVEIGSGGGFLNQFTDGFVTSDILPLDGVELFFSAEEMPFQNQELSAICMLNVFHHIPKPYLFLKEAERTLKSGGKIVMIEPANSLFSRFVYRRFHHEPFEPGGEREITPGNPLSNSNQALPYIYFQRDRDWFNSEFPELKITKTIYHTPFSYILSGGVSRSALLPGWMFSFARFAEWLLTPFSRQMGLFCTVVIERR